MSRGNKAIGTTGRGIGPCYEDKAARRGIRLGELMDEAHFSERLREVLDYHNFALQHYFKVDALDYQQVLDQAMRQAEALRPMVGDVGAILHDLLAQGPYYVFTLNGFPYGSFHGRRVKEEAAVERTVGKAVEGENVVRPLRKQIMQFFFGCRICQRFHGRSGEP